MDVDEQASPHQVFPTQPSSNQKNMGTMKSKIKKTDKTENSEAHSRPSTIRTGVSCDPGDTGRRKPSRKRSLSLKQIRDDQKMNKSDMKFVREEPKEVACPGGLDEPAPAPAQPPKSSYVEYWN